MTDKTPGQTDDLTTKDKKDTKKDKDSPEYNPNDLRDKDDLLGWLDESGKLQRKSKQPGGRRRTTIVDSGIKRELADIIGKGQWLEAPTPEQLNQMQSTTPAALKYLIDLASSSSAKTSSSLSSTASSSSTSSLDPSGRTDLTPEMALKRLAETRTLFIDSVVAEIEEHQLKFALIIVLVIIILIHMFVSLVNS